VEDDYLEFKTELLNSRKAAKALDEDKDDLLADLAGFANAAGGLIVVGITEDSQGRANSLATVTGDEARKLADKIRDLTAAHVRPGILQLEAVPFPMSDDGGEWIVIIRIPDGPDKPYMSVYRDQTRFAIRVGNRKRTMAYEEIQQRFLANPQQAHMASLVTEIASIKSLVADIRKQLER
jgi:predicted HTH transcriptional regulator